MGGDEVSSPQKPAEKLAETGFSDSGDLCSQTVDLSQWFATDLTSSGSFDLGIIAATSFGHLLDSIPIPSLMIDGTYCVAFANKACQRISMDYRSIQGVPFETLVPRSRNAQKAQDLVRRVFVSRRPQVAEGILEMGGRKVWGRLHFSSVRIERERFVLLCIEDLTEEKTQLMLHHREEEQLKKTKRKLEAMVQDLTRKSADYKVKLDFEARQHAKTSELLDVVKQKFLQLCDETPAGVAVMGSDGSFQYVNARFKELFGYDSEDLPSGLEWCSKVFPDSDDKVLSAWDCIDSAASKVERADEQLTLTIEGREDTPKLIGLKAIKQADGDYLLICVDLTLP